MIDNEYERSYDMVPVGVIGCSREPGYPCRYINKRMLKVLGYASSDEYIDATRGLCINSVHPDDRSLFEVEIKRSFEEEKEYNAVFRMLRKDGGEIWVDGRGNESVSGDGEKLILSVLIDITPQKKSEEKYRESEQRFRAAVECAGINVWEYDIVNRRIIYSPDASHPDDNVTVVDNAPETAIAVAKIQPEQYEQLRGLFAGLEAGKPKVTGDFWTFNPKTGSHWWERVTYTTVFDDNGKPIKAYGACIDVTQMKLAEQRFNEEIALRDRIFSFLVAACRVNLTKKYVESMRIGKGKDCAAQYRDTIDFRMRTLAFAEENLMDDAQNERLSPDALLESFNSGTASLKEEYLVRMSDNSYHWIHTDVHVLKSPQTGDVTAFFYNQDLTNEALVHSVMNTVFCFDYEEVGIVNTRNGIYRKCAGGGSVMEVNDVCAYEENIDLFCEKRVAQRERARMAETLKLDNIQAKLRNNKVWCVRFVGLLQDGCARFCEMRFQYLSDEGNIILITRTDIDNLVKNEQKKQKQLEAAMRAAKQADSAKTEFLARMSHDMRTPMNTIMGLATLGMDEIADEKAQFYFSNINQSAGFLLGLINDVLDMSKVETGAVTLHQEPYSITDFRTQIMTMFGPQCDKKGIKFNFIAPARPAGYMMVDKLRFNQIIYNLISNAVKYTPDGGTVDFIIEYIAFNENRIRRRFTVRDNGIGMSAEFQKTMFEPFTREHTAQTANIDGTGLGLAIAKHMTELMGGTISVKSEPSKGSEFIVELELESGMENPQSGEKPDERPNEKKIVSLSGKRVLLCEDHPLNAKIAQKLLMKVGVTVDCADNGQTGLDMFALSAENYYDAVLMDIRMPVMDGLGATACIRALARADAKTVPIIAMTANAYDDDVEKSRAAGMNAHLAKPIDATTLYDTLAAYLC